VETAPLEAVACGLDALGQDVFTPDRRAFTARRRAVIDANPELQEREALKGMSLTDSMARAMAHRGLPDLAARVTAELGALALKITYERGSDLGNTDDFSALARQALSEVRANVLSVYRAPLRSATRCPGHAQQGGSHRR
jgi:hypothetical protein